jgi:hypothetical protein
MTAPGEESTPLQVALENLLGLHSLTCEDMLERVCKQPDFETTQLQDVWNALDTEPLSQKIVLYYRKHSKLYRLKRKASR